MTYYAGLDIGLEQPAVCIMDESSKIIHETKVPSDPEALSQYLIYAELSFTRVGLEACPLSQWLFNGLVAAGLPAICIEIRHLKAAMSAMTHKTDRNDARGIGTLVRLHLTKHGFHSLAPEPVQVTSPFGEELAFHPLPGGHGLGHPTTR